MGWYNIDSSALLICGFCVAGLCGTVSVGLCGGYGWFMVFVGLSGLG